MIKAGRSISDAMKDPELRKHGKAVANLMQRIRKDEVPEIVLTLSKEHDAISDAREFLEREFKASILIQKKAGYDPENKASHL